MRQLNELFKTMKANMAPELRERIDKLEKAGLFGCGKDYEKNRYPADYIVAAWGEGYFPYLYQKRPDTNFDPNQMGTVFSWDVYWEIGRQSAGPKARRNSVLSSVFETENENTNLAWSIPLGLLLSGCSTARTQTSPAAWNSLTSGRIREEIVRVAGQPSYHSGLGEDSWRKGKWELRVSYDERGQAVSIVRRLVIN